jgi:hypothetical protein
MEGVTIGDNTCPYQSVALPGGEVSTVLKYQSVPMNRKAEPALRSPRPQPTEQCEDKTRNSAAIELAQILSNESAPPAHHGHLS